MDGDLRMGTLKIVRWVVGPVMENTYLVYDEETKEGIFIDPGDEADALIRGAEDIGVIIKRIVNTHGHIDHIGAVSAIQKHWEAPFALHSGDRDLVENAPYFGRLIGLPFYSEIPVVNEYLEDGNKIFVGTNEGRVIETPGHTAGGICIYFEEDRVLFSGDTLFRGSIGRTDFPGAEYDTLIRSIRKKLWTLPDDTLVYPGHGEVTTIGLEKRYNPFVGGATHREEE
ncbi:MAG: MBL fold metallo-hydrolase [bacterium JZ-2024 1]